MKKLSYIILLAVTSLSSCTKMIDLYPESNISTGNYYKSIAEVSTALTGCYNAMQAPLREEWSLTEIRSDNAIMGVPGSLTTQNRDLSDLDMFMLNTAHPGNYNYWSTTYANIRNINLVLNALNVNYNEGTKTISFDTLLISGTDADRKRLASEALFIRAYHYFNLVRLYGGVFLVHEPISADDAKLINRSTVNDIYDLIVADLQAADFHGNKNAYSASSANLGRANSWAAKALLAKVYLNLNRKADAIPLLQAVINTSGHGLQANYSNIFSIANEMNNEIIFAVRYKAGGLGLGSPLPNLFAPLQSGSAVVNGDGRGFNYPTTDIATNYLTITVTGASITSGSTTITIPTANANIRAGMYITATQIPANVTISAVSGNTITLSAAATGNSTNGTLTIGDPRRTATIATFNPGARLYPVKLISNPAIANDAENDWIVLRYADVLLMMAEAQGNTPASLTLINQVRNRARLAPLTATDVATTAQFEKALADERRWEFAFENQRYFDLMRFNVTLTTVNAVQTLRDHFAKEYPTHYNLYPAPRLTLAELQANVTNDKLLLPIPQREIDNNTIIRIPQNPGY